jgi:galactokinase
MTPITAYAPGRAELLGNHTDYNEGYVLAVAVDRGLVLTGTPRGDRTIKLHSHELNQNESVSIDHLASEKVVDWSRYTLGVVDQFLRHGIPVGGFEADISGNLPHGAGLSSSAALENATVLFLLKAFGGKLDPMQIARFSQMAEHDFVGVRCGLLDQISSLMSKNGEVTFIDCRTFEIDHVPLDGGSVSIIIANSGVKHSLVEGEYNTRRTDCEAAARAIGVPALRDVPMSLLEKFKSRLSDRIYRRALHIVGENERVLAGVEALRRNDIATFGRLMYQSHESSRLHFENSCPELDLLVETARRTPGVLGARLSGGGFGGATINVIEKSHEDKVVRALTAALPGVRCLITRAADGALAHAEKHPA